MDKKNKNKLNPIKDLTPKHKRHSVYTDLALESAECIKPADCGDTGEIDGIKMDIYSHSLKNGDLKITWIEIINEAGAASLNRPIGNYVTLESEALKQNDAEAHEEIIKVLADLLGKLKSGKKSGKVLIAGLGNSNVTPDALGPRVVSKTLITRHLEGKIPEDLEHSVVSVSAISPGVMGTTGIETCEIVKGIVERIKPDIVVVIDALAARRASRVNATIQISDTGLSPGSGMGNVRKALNSGSLGVPVLAIGVPTVHTTQVWRKPAQH